jgi:hypothetical protein
MKKNNLDYKIIDNFLPKENFVKIKELLLGNGFPWYYYPNISQIEKISKGKLFYMSHILYEYEPRSAFYPLIKDNLLNFIDIKSIVRIKANLYPNQSIKKVNEMHVDYDFKHNGALFSINTNNGGTLLKDGTKINSVENRMLFFDPSIEHDSENCTDEKTRINININYF